MTDTTKKDKKNSQITGNLSNSYNVQKSTPLFSLWTSKLTLQEFKILDTYLSRIDSKKPEQRDVRFAKGELERLLKVKLIKPAELKQRLKHLMGQVVELKDKRKKNGFVLISLFSIAVCEKDDNGLWQVDLSCTAEAMEYFFNIDEIGYLRYKLRNIIHISSRYSYILFTYLEANRFRQSWDVEIDELKQILNCNDDASYSEFKIFNNRILKRCQKELFSKTEIRYDYKTIKQGRKVVKVKFIIEPLSAEEAEETEEVSKIQENKTSYQQLELKNTENENPWLDFFSSACGNEFSKAEIEVIFAMICTMDLPPHEMGVNFSRYHYLLEKYTMLNLAAEKTNIRERFSYFKAMIANDKEQLN